MSRLRIFGASVLAAAFAAFVFSGMAAAQTSPIGTLDQDNLNAASCAGCYIVAGVAFPNDPSVRFNIEWAQTFTAGRTGTLTSVQIRAAKVSTESGSLEVAIASQDSTGSPDATLASTTMPASSFTSTDTPVTVTFANPAEVQAGEGYAMVLSTTGITAYQLGASEGTYPGGNLLLREKSNGFDPWTASSGLDIKFATYVTPPPVANDDSYTVAEDEPLVVAVPGVFSNDVSGSSASAAFKATDPAHGRLVLAPDGSFIYLPDRDFNGTDSFTYRAAQGSLRSNPAIVTISVTPAAEPPAPNSPPAITRVSPAPGSKLRDATPTIRATVGDSATDLAKSNVRLFVDGKRVTKFSYDRATDRLSHTTKRLKPGRHTVLIVARDGGGLSASKIWGFGIRR